MIILITGGAGFIGSHLIRHFVNKYPNYNIFNIDALTYAGNLEKLNANLISIEFWFIWPLNRNINVISLFFS